MFTHFGRCTLPHEVLIVVEHGTDGTLELAMEAAAKQANFRVIDSGPQRGKGHAVRSGMRQAQGDLVFYMDADLSVPLEEVDRFLAYFENHPEVDVLVGNRQHALSRIEPRQTPVRQMMGQIFNRILRSLAPLDLRDTQCGFKAFRREAAEAIFARQRLDGFAFDVEVLLLAQSLGHRIADLPVRWINSPESKVHIIRDSARMLWDTLRLRRLVARSENAARLAKRDLSKI
jgi:dolichyl-phosphate beta-glucosyltransferase